MGNNEHFSPEIGRNRVRLRREIGEAVVFVAVVPLFAPRVHLGALPAKRGLAAAKLRDGVLGVVRVHVGEGQRLIAADGHEDPALLLLKPRVRDRAGGWRVQLVGQRPENQIRSKRVDLSAALHKGRQRYRIATPRKKQPLGGGLLAELAAGLVELLHAPMAGRNLAWALRPIANETCRTGRPIVVAVDRLILVLRRLDIHRQQRPLVVLQVEIAVRNVEPRGIRTQRHSRREIELVQWRIGSVTGQDAAAKAQRGRNYAYKA